MCYMALAPLCRGRSWVDDLWFSGCRIVCQGPKVPCRMEEVEHGELLAFAHAVYGESGCFFYAEGF